MTELLTFFIILAAGFFSAGIFRSFHMPYVTTLIFVGILMGPFFFNIIEINDTINFLGSVGLIFLMFIAGHEVKFASFRKFGKDIVLLAFLNAMLPFLVGFGVSTLFGYSIFTSIVLGTTFMSSSVAVIIPSLQSNNLVNTKLGRLVMSSTILEDLSSLLLLSVVLQSFKRQTPIPLPLYIPLVIFLFVFLKMAIPLIQRVYNIFYESERSKRDLFETRLRFVFLILFASVILFELIGMHSIVAGFVIGAVLSDSIKPKILEKIRIISYGIFIPTFFLIMGAKTDFSVFSTGVSLVLTLAVVLGLILSKVFSSLIAARLIGLPLAEGLFIGFATIPQLSTTLAVAFAAQEYGLLTQELITSLVVLSMLTTIISPMLIRLFAKRMRTLEL